MVGSLRKESYSKKLAQHIIDKRSNACDFNIIPLDDLPVYNQDFDDLGPVPPSCTRFPEPISTLDGIIFITPEYNRSVPAVLKNALDIGSRSYGQSVWDGKPGAVSSCSPGNVSGFGANHHLRQSLVFLNVPVMQQPEVYLTKVHEFFNDEGKIEDANAQAFIDQAVASYIIWMNRFC